MMNFWKWRRYFRLSLHIFKFFFKHFKNDLKKNYTSKPWWYIPLEKKIRVFRILSNFNVPCNIPIALYIQNTTKLNTFHQSCQQWHFFKNCAILVTFFSIRKLRKSFFISMVVIIKIILQEWGIVLVIKASQENKSYVQTYTLF